MAEHAGYAESWLGIAVLYILVARCGGPRSPLYILVLGAPYMRPAVEPH
jgi:hypothetical protein